MIGNNEWRLNPATMALMVQEWIDRNMVADTAPKVHSVRYDSNQSQFVVTLVEQKKEDSE